MTKNFKGTKGAKLDGGHPPGPKVCGGFSPTGAKLEGGHPPGPAVAPPEGARGVFPRSARRDGTGV